MFIYGTVFSHRRWSRQYDIAKSILHYFSSVHAAINNTQNGSSQKKRKVNIDKIMYAVHYLLKSTNTPIQEISDNHLKKLAFDLKISRKAIKDAIAETQPTVKLKW